MSLDLTVGVLGLVVAIISIAIAYLVGRRGRRRPRLRYITDFDILMSPEKGIAREALKVAYANHDVPRVSRTSVAIWNHHGDTVSASDIVETDPLRFQLPQGDIALQVQTMAVSRAQCRLSAKLDDDHLTRVLLGFDFLDAGDGAVFEVLHAGSEPFVVAGTVKGAKLEPKASADLTLTALNFLALKPIRRAWEKVSSQAGAAIASGIAYTVFVAMFIWSVLEYLLLDPIEVEEGYYPSALIILISGLLSLALVVIMAFFLLARTRIPSSIVAHRLYETQETTTD